MTVVVDSMYVSVVASNVQFWFSWFQADMHRRERGGGVLCGLCASHVIVCFVVHCRRKTCEDYWQIYRPLHFKAI